MGTYLWCLHLLWSAARDPGWHWGWHSAWGQHIEVGTPAADKASLGSFLPSGGRRLLLRCYRSHLAEARGSGYSQLSPCSAAPTDTRSCQQVLRSGSRQRVHGLEWRHSRWQVTRVSYPSCRGAGCGLSGRDHGCVAHCGWCPQCQCRSRSLVRDGGALTPLADSKTVSAVSHPGQSLQSVQHTNYV